MATTYSKITKIVIVYVITGLIISMLIPDPTQTIVVNVNDKLSISRLLVLALILTLSIYLGLIYPNEYRYPIFNIFFIIC